MSHKPFRVLTILAATAIGLSAAPPRSTRTATLQCQPGWRAQAVGQYGGVGFSVSCNNGRGNDRIVGPVGTAYAARVGVESDSGGFDCAYSGDSATVDVSCAAVRLTIR
jgi:hypothetical protein